MPSSIMRTARTLPDGGVLLDRDPPWTETPRTENPLDRDTLDRDHPLGQRTHPWTENPPQTYGGGINDLVVSINIVVQAPRFSLTYVFHDIFLNHL